MLSLEEICANCIIENYNINELHEFLGDYLIEKLEYYMFTQHYKQFKYVLSEIKIKVEYFTVKMTKNEWIQNFTHIKYLKTVEQYEHHGHNKPIWYYIEK